MKKPPYKRIWTAFGTVAIFAISMPDKFLELYKEFMHSGLTPAFAVALALWISQRIRDKRLDRRDARWESKLDAIMTAVGAAEISKPAEVRNLKRYFLLSRKAIPQVNQRRKIMERLKSRKLWLAIAGALIPVLNTELGVNLDSNLILGMIGILATAIAAFAHVDAKKAGVTNVDTKPTGDTGAAV